MLPGLRPPESRPIGPLRQERKAAGICRQCSNKAITGQIRCEVCRDKHNRNG